MKTLIKNILFFAVLIFISSIQIGAQNNSQPDEIIFKALTDELERNSKDLVLNEYKPPFFISYQLYDVNTMVIKATMGSIRSSQMTPLRTNNIRLMVGDYSLNDENFMGSGSQFTGGGYLPVPIENDYLGIRRAFWTMSDRIYKSSLQKYEQKLTAIKQQNKSESEKLDDFTKAAPVNFLASEVEFKMDKTKWENIAREVSAVFKPYGEIASSTTYIYFIKAWVYTTTTEGAKIKCPVNVCCLLVNAFTQAEDGEPMTDHVLYFAQTPDQLPQLDKVKSEVKQLADYLVSLRNAPSIKDSYSGPVIFEGDAVAELFSQKFFSPNSGLFTYREPIMPVERQSMSDQTSVRFDNRIGQKICSNTLSIKATPKVKNYNGIPLVGSFDIDAEGIVPADELVLVQNGILKTLLTDRIPTAKVKESNGHKRNIWYRGGYPSSAKAPGVINIAWENGKPISTFRKDVLQEFAQNGLEYIYLVKKLQVPNAGMNNVMTSASSRNLSVSKPISIYKVSTKTGEEQLVRSAIFGDFQMSAFKQILQATQEQTVYNTVIFKNGIEIPSSFIVPQSLVFEDISIEPDKGVTKIKLPVVPNPVLAEK